MIFKNTLAQIAIEQNFNLMKMECTSRGKYCVIDEADGFIALSVMIGYFLPLGENSLLRLINYPTLQQLPVLVSYHLIYLYIMYFIVF